MQPPRFFSGSMKLPSYSVEPVWVLDIALESSAVEHCLQYYSEIGPTGEAGIGNEGGYTYDVECILRCQDGQPPPRP